MRRVVFSILATLSIIATAVVAVAPPAGAEPGDLDGAFGVCGYLPQDSPVGVGTLSGKTVVVRIDALTSESSRVHVWRLTLSGAPDPTFGTDGVTTFDLIGRADGASPNGMREDAFGRFLIPITMNTQSSTLGYVTRLRPDGIVDASFSGGTTIIDLRAVASIEPMADGSIFALMIPPGAVGAGLPVHLSDDGSIATTLSLGGTVRLVQAPIGASGTTVVAVDGASGALTRWNLDGSLDSTFAPIPPPATPFATNAYFGAIHVGLSGDVSTVSYAFSGGQLHRIIARFHGDGSPDLSFGSNGVTVLPGVFRTPSDHEIHVSPGGEVATIADIADDTGAPTQVITRLTRSGQLDDTYGEMGSSAVSAWARRGTSWTAASTVYGAYIGEYDTLTSVLVKTSSQPLKQGAGLIVGWNGDAWPTRFGNDPGPECPVDTPYWPDADIVRGITTVPGNGGYELDLYGGLHPFSIGLQHPRPANPVGGPYWSGWDITRGIAATPDASGGYVLDGWGGLHTFGTAGHARPPRITNGPYWTGWDITRGIALMPDGTSGYIVDGWGGMHPFSTPGHPLPPRVHGGPYWTGWDIVRGVSILPDGTGGYILDGFGGVHPFGIGNHPGPPRPGPNAPYAPGEDWARGFTFIAPNPTIGSSATGSVRDREPATGSMGARLATAQRRGPTPVGPASP